MIAEAPVHGQFIRQTIDHKGSNNGIRFVSDGVEEVYSFGAPVMAIAENYRLDLQAQTIWGRDYRRRHEGLSTAHTFKRMAIIGLSADADQVKQVLALHCQAQVDVIEFDPKKYQIARAVLEKTNPQDLASGRLTLKNEQAAEFLSQQPGTYSYIEADKVAIHLSTANRVGLYESAAQALKPDGLFCVRDIFAKSWSVEAEQGHQENPLTLEALKNLRGIMSKILDNTWTERGAPLWETLEDMAEEPTKFAPSLVHIPEYSEICRAPFRRGDHPEALISQFIVIMPALGKEMARAAQPGDSETAIEADNRWERARQFVQGVETEGVMIALPHYVHNMYSPSLRAAG